VEPLATWIVRLAGLYLLVGWVFSVPFVLRGARRIDPVAREGTWGFRLIIIPGVIALWPALARRWVRGAPPPEERNAHRDAAGEGRA
jgi:hypothetical protein